MNFLKKIVSNTVTPFIPTVIASTVDSNYSYYFKDTSLHQAAQSDDRTRVQTLIQSGGVDVNLLNADKTPALIVAARFGRLEIVEMFLCCRSIQIELCDASDFSALVWAINGGHSSIVELLLKYCADFQAFRAARTPLMYAAIAGHVEIVRALLKMHAEVNIETQECPLTLQQHCVGWASLDFARHYKNSEVIVVLLAAGALGRLERHQVVIDKQQQKLRLVQEQQATLQRSQRLTDLESQHSLLHTELTMVKSELEQTDSVHREADEGRRRELEQTRTTLTAQLLKLQIEAAELQKQCREERADKVLAIQKVEMLRLETERIELDRRDELAQLQRQVDERKRVADEQLVQLRHEIEAQQLITQQKADALEETRVNLAAVQHEFQSSQQQQHEAVIRANELTEQKRLSDEQLQQRLVDQERNMATQTAEQKRVSEDQIRQLHEENQRLQTQLSALELQHTSSISTSSTSSEPSSVVTSNIPVGKSGKKNRHAGSTSASSAASSECVFCNERPCTHILTPCGHRVLCGVCATKKWDACPICRVAVQTIIKVFDS